MLCQIKSRSSGQVLKTFYPTHGTQGRKVLLNDLDHMTKRAATPIDGNIFFYRNTGLIGLLQ